MLNFTTHGGPTDAPTLLIAHGLFGSARNWGVIAKRMSEDRQVITVDMRNHGESPRATTQTYADMAGDLAKVIAHVGGPMDVVGHSMGGKAAMVLAMNHPELVDRVVVADIAPVAYGHSQSHLIHAMRGLDLTSVEKRSDADRALRATIPDDGTRAFLLQSLDIPSKSWRLNLDVLEDEMPKIVGFPETDGVFIGPVFFLSGGASEYVLPDHRATIKSHFPGAKFAKIPGAGHWLHAEKPREFEQAMRVFFAR